MIGTSRKRAIFLDRDGTINQEVSYLSDERQLRLIDGAAEGIRLLKRLGYQIVLITNQAGVARGYFSEDKLRDIHSRLTEMLAAESADLDAIYYCPHHPEGLAPYRVACECRKPQPGMLKRAARDLNIGLEESIMVGDKTLDLKAGFAVNCRGILVRTGYGRESEVQFSSETTQPDFIADDLLGAAHWISNQ
jgi:D-glycero-D-manno-heptose 1,7-bisphosphate phosphatase